MHSPSDILLGKKYIHCFHDDISSKRSPPDCHLRGKINILPYRRLLKAAFSPTLLRIPDIFAAILLQKILEDWKFHPAFVSVSYVSIQKAVYLEMPFVLHVLPILSFLPE